jgi:hypothetical protein
MHDVGHGIKLRVLGVIERLFIEKALFEMADRFVAMRTVFLEQPMVSSIAAYMSLLSVWASMVM